MITEGQITWNTRCLLILNLFRKNVLFHKLVSGSCEYVVKAQILAGGRGKGKFPDGKPGLSGVYITYNKDEALDAVENMIGKRLVTKQTIKDGVKVDKVMNFYSPNYSVSFLRCFPKIWQTISSKRFCSSDNFNNFQSIELKSFIQLAMEYTIHFFIFRIIKYSGISLHILIL